MPVGVEAGASVHLVGVLPGAAAGEARVATVELTQSNAPAPVPALESAIGITSLMVRVVA